MNIYNCDENLSNIYTIVKDDIIYKDVYNEILRHETWSYIGWIEFNPHCSEKENIIMDEVIFMLLLKVNQDLIFMKIKK